MITYQIPHTARYLSESLRFSALFNVLTGEYDFSENDTNKQVVLTEMKKNAIYFIDRMTVGADIPESVYTDSIDVVPSMRIKHEIAKKQVYKRPITLPQFSDNRDIGAWTYTDKTDEVLIVDFEGVLKQVAETVGESEIRIYCAIDIYEINDNEFVRAFKNDLSIQTGQQVRGALI